MAAQATTGLPARLALLRERVMAAGGSFPGGANPLSRSVALWRASAPGRSVVQVRAAYLLELVRLARIEVEDDWRLAGNHLPTAHLDMRVPEPGNPEHAECLRDLGTDPDRAGAVRDAVAAWHALRCYGVGEAESTWCKGLGGWGSGGTATVFWASGWIENHSVRDYAKVLRVGFAGIRAEIDARLESADPAAPDFPQRENFLRAARDVCEAGITLGSRYADAARRRAATADSAESRERFLRMAESCDRVPRHGARTLAEAVQSLWLAHILTCGEDGINANSIGRLDAILYPYYAADLAAGRTTPDEAREWMQELACRMYLEYDVQAITLGGTARDGSDAVNEMSMLILEATRDVGFVRDVSVRLHRNSPEPFVRLACEMIADGGGIPFMFNDDCFIPALTEHGIAVEDARDYAPIGCIELTVPGRANPHAVSGWFNSLKCLELALHDGVDPASGARIGPPTGRLEDFETFDALYGAYRTQVGVMSRRMVYHCNRGELAQREGGPLPCWSVLTDDCIARGRDITDGGAVYNYHSICFLGAANTADALVALRKLVFEDKALDPRTVLDALAADFAGYEDVRQALCHRAPKYGNDVEEVDAMARAVADHFIDIMDTMRSPLGGRYFVHLFSFRCNIEFGRTVGATPDGRRAGEPLAYSLSAHQGRDVSGITAMLNSLSRLPHSRAAGATAAIIEADPALVAGAAGVERLIHLTRTALALGVGQLQWNVVTAERLEKAKADPERYGNIAVRVAGYSQLFRLIEPALQDHIIARTKHTR